MKTDHLVIGAGVAGLTYAIKIASAFPERTVTILNKSSELVSNTRMAQGGIAVVTDHRSDSFEKHVQDTLTAGAGLCNEKVVRTIVSEGPGLIHEMIKWGARFDTQNGRLMLGREGGHGENRIVHKGDQTGLELAEVLLAKLPELPNIKLVCGHMAVDLLSSKEHGRCIGVIVLGPDDEVYPIYSTVTVLATGGVGRVYGFTTNPAIATGDGIAMAHRVGATVSNMEFIQFHPTALCHPKMEGPFLISEAVRGAGARLMNSEGAYFMQKYDPREDLAPRDIVSRAVFTEMENLRSDHVYLDCSSIDERELFTHFPTITKRCLQLGIDLRFDPIPVRPSAHYLCGGIDTDMDGQTSIAGLYAVGECANTGLHGANRLASNSLLEALVMAHRCSLKTATSGPLKLDQEDCPRFGKIKNHSSLQGIRKEIGPMMDSLVGIVRTETGLKHALDRMKEIEEEIAEWSSAGQISMSDIEVRNLVTVATLIIRQSLARKENVGGFYRSDLVCSELSEANHSA